MALFEFLIKNKTEYRENEAMCRHTTFRIGGCAKYFVIPKDRDELCLVITECIESGERYYILGRGSNVLFDDGGFDGAVISTEKLCNVKVCGNTVFAECGVPLTQLAALSRDNSLSGLEFAYGIPGLVGGAVFMNAGAYGGEISSVLKKSTFFNTKTGEVSSLSENEHEFGYRTSYYKTHPECVILSAEFELIPGEKSVIKAQMDKNMEARRQKQPLEFPSAGSVFKRAPGHYTGQMVEEIGMKGIGIGDAVISEKHAGFIVNKGNATAKDVLSLVDVIKERVYKEYGVMLECELIYVK